MAIRKSGKVGWVGITPAGRAENKINVNSEFRMYNILGYGNRSLGYGMIDLEGMPIIGQRQEIITYSGGNNRYVMVVHNTLDGREEYPPETFVKMQEESCKKLREEGYKDELFFYVLGQKRDPKRDFRARGIVVEKGRNSDRSDRIKQISDNGSGLWVPMNVRRYGVDRRN